jgi:hypothetical protein
MAFMSTLPYFVAEAGPSEVDGVGNYRLDLRSADPYAVCHRVQRA